MNFLHNLDVVIRTVGVLRTLMLGVRETVILGVPPSRLRVDGVFLCGPVLAQVRRCSSRSTSFEAQVATHTAAETLHSIILSRAFKVIHMQCCQSHVQYMLYTAIRDASRSKGISETFRTQALLRPLQ